MIDVDFSSSSGTRPAALLQKQEHMVLCDMSSRLRERERDEEEEE